MRLVFIHGAPAAGKLTTGKALAEITSGRLFDNHAAIDLARTVFEFGAPGFWDLVDRVRLDVLEAAASSDLPLLIMTSVYVEPQDVTAFERFELIAQKNGGDLFPVFLQCSTDEIIRRVDNPDRVARRKMASPESARAFLNQYSVSAVPRPNCLTLDSTITSAAENASAIARHLNLVSC